MREHRELRRVSAPTASHVIDSYMRLLECLDTPVALSCWILAREGDWTQLVSKGVDPLAYDNPQHFRKDYLAVSVLSKADFLETRHDRREAAVQRFWQGEKVCAESNLRLGLYAESKLSPVNPRIHGVLHRARELIRRWLGNSPSEYASKHGFKPRFGPGVTSSVKGDVVIAKKYESRLDVTPRLYPYYRGLIGVSQRHLDVALAASNRVAFVPKNSKTDRTIAVEPTVNVYAQLGVGGMLRHALARVGLNLDTQWEYNRWLASRGETARLATIDLSMASDTLCRELVWLLLPEGWADLLDVVRSSHGLLDGVEFEYEKFSSMGNGSTFELETMIFYALTLASGSKKALSSVFGDDIIVEQHCADLLVGTLHFCGFEVNSEKSFLDGSFRESCGSDFHSGVEVRPFFWKSLEPTLFYKMANDIARWAKLSSDYLDARYLPVWLRCVSRVPPGMRVGVPAGLGDIGIIVNFDAPLLTTARWKNDTKCWRFPALTFQPRTVPVFDRLGALGASLDGLRTLEREPGYHSVRGRGVYRITDHYLYTAFGGWSGLGIWV